MYEYLPVCVDMYHMCAVLAQDTTRPSSQHKGLLFASEGYWMGSKRLRQEIEDREKGEGNKGEGEGVLPLDKEETIGGS